MKTSKLFLFVLIPLTFTIPASLHANDNSTKDQLGQQAVREIVYDVLLLYGINGPIYDDEGDGSGGDSGGGSGDGPGGGTGDGDGGGDGRPSNPYVINIVTNTGQSFSLTKLDVGGNDMLATADSWSCLKDNLNNLVWEVKRADSSLHGQSDSFSWYDPTQILEKKVGFADNSGASCKGYVAGDPSTYCNTAAYVGRVNSATLCGEQGWRLPSVEEVKDLVQLSAAAPDLYSALFPQGTGGAVWTGSQYVGYPGFAYHVYLSDGYTHGNDKSGNLPVLLVRNAQP